MRFVKIYMDGTSLSIAQRFGFSLTFLRELRESLEGFPQGHVTNKHSRCKSCGEDEKRDFVLLHNNSNIILFAKSFTNASSWMLNKCFSFAVVKKIC